MASAVDGPGNGKADASVAELIKQLSEQTSRLARQEVELAKAEMTVKGRRMGLGAGMLGGAGMAGFYAFGALVAAGILALTLVVASWLAALIMAGVLAFLAFPLALGGKTKVSQATPPVPEQATASMREDVQWAKSRAQAGRR